MPKAAVFPGFVGPSYVLEWPTLDCERAVNLIPKRIESPGSPEKACFVGSPGLVTTWTLPDVQLRALFAQDGRCFAVAGSTFCELFAGGGVTNRGPVKTSGSLASIASSGTGGHQLFIVAGGVGYIFDLNANTLTPIGASAFPANAAWGVFIDGVFIVQVTASNQFQLSALFDGTTWSGLDVAQRESSSDQLTRIFANHRELWLFGSKRTEVWVDTGNASFPFQPYPGAFIEQGAYPNTVAAFDNTLAFLGQNENGTDMVFRMNGYTPTRMSSHGVEAQIALMRRTSRIDDAEAFVYEELGQEQYILNFPTAMRTFACDASTNWWHERDWYNVGTGMYEQARQRVHCFAFGQHLVGDRQTGVVYVQDSSFLTDAGNLIRRRRRFPHMVSAGRRVFYPRLELACSVGDGIAGQPQQMPQAVLRFSNDWGKTFGNDYQAALGLIGQYDTRVYWNCLGSGRARVFEIEVDDPVPPAWLAAYVTAEEGLH